MAPIPFRAGGAVALGGNQPEVWVNSSWHSQDDVNGSGIPGLVWGDNAFDTIQNGSNAVAIGGMVHVAAGTYNENVVIDHSLIINGSNSGIAGNSSGRGDETIFNGAPGPVSTSGVSTGIEVTADDVVIDGVTIQGYDNGIASYANVSDLTVKNSRILDCDNGLNLLASSSTISDNYLTTC